MPAWQILFYLSQSFVIPILGVARWGVLTPLTWVSPKFRDWVHQRASSMIIDNGRIRWIGPDRELKSPAGAEIVDLSGAFVMPGMINLHGHVGNTIDLDQNAKNFTRENIEKNLKTALPDPLTKIVLFRKR